MRFPDQQKSWHDECGVFGIFDPSGLLCDAAQKAYLGLFALQHRGQDSAGIAVNNHGSILCHRGQGLVVETFDEMTLNLLKGHAAIGHVRYPSQNDTGLSNAQPMLIKYRAGQIALGLNGCLTNRPELRRQLQESGAIFQTSSDAEILLALLARNRIATDHIEPAIQKMMTEIQGAYAMVLISPGKVIGVRDPLGIRPLCLGRLGGSWLLASESCAIDSIGGTFLRDVFPGEIITLSASGMKSSLFEPDQVPPIQFGRTCLFEYVYFARPDSTIDGTNVQDSRFKAGQKLACEKPCQADLVIGAPDSGLSASMGYANASGIPYGQGLLKNRYVGRTFIQPNQLQREMSVSMKFSALKHAVSGKRIILVDDSIIRGTTTRHIVLLLKNAGAAAVHMRIASPPVFYPCFYGVDTPSQDDLPACKMTKEEICSMIGADSLEYLSLQGLKQAAGDRNGSFCASCFDGEFPAGLPAKQINAIKRPDWQRLLNEPLTQNQPGEESHA